MSVEVALQTPLAHALNTVIQPKLVEVGWSTGGDDDSALSEYIILMLVNGKTQEQIAAELSGDLLNLGPDDPGARDFSEWLFQQLELLKSDHAGVDGSTGGYIGAEHNDAQTAPQDADMGDATEPSGSNIPTGPKSMRNGNSNRFRDPRDKRILGHLAKAMDRSSDSALHRVRQQGGNERVSMHRSPPTGPRQHGQARGGGRIMNGRGGMAGPPGPAGPNIMAMTPQQQYEMFAMLEQQSRMMAQFLTPQQQQHATFAGPSMLLVWLWLGSPKDPRGSVGLFCFCGL